MIENTLKCIIVDDDPIVQIVLKKYIVQLLFLKVVASCKDISDALSYIANNSVDIIFSDIQMLHLRGLDLIKILKDKPAVIFIKSYNEPFIDGANIGVVDFITKPFEFERFVTAVNRAKDYLQKGNIPITKELKFIFIKIKGKLVKIIFSEILYIEAVKDYLKIVTESEQYMVLMTMKSIEQLLDPVLFFRTHRSFIVSIDAIHSFVGNVIEMKNKKSVPIVQNKKEKLFTRLNISK
ncbi:DNA-binding response regulator [Elizabethkingia anophelis]|nr:DNA-binding response regulator [Elizabethkingia anophelis]